MQLPQLIIDPKRECSRCTLCCTTMAVTELKKPPNVKCEHICGDGCAIYESRPPSCQGFYCAWRLGYFTPDDRPDRLGVVFAFQMGTKFSMGPLLVAEEARPGACEESRPYTLILQESMRQLVLIRQKDKRRLVGPKSELDRVRPMIDKAIRELYGEK